MIDHPTTLVTLFSVIGVVCLVGYALSQFLRAAACRRKRPEHTLATQWRAFAPLARTGRPMHHQYQNLQGAKVRDLVTGIEGIITAVSYYLNGCVRVCIQPEAKDHKPADEVEWCDVQQVRRIGVGVRQQMGLAGTEAEPPVDYPRTAAVGGPQKDAPKA